MFGNSYSGFRLKTYVNVSDIPKFGKQYSSGVVFAGSDTHGFINVSFDPTVRRVAVGGGNADRIAWSDNIALLGTDQTWTGTQTFNTITTSGAGFDDYQLKVEGGYDLNDKAIHVYGYSVFEGNGTNSMNGVIAITDSQGFCGLSISSYNGAGRAIYANGTSYFTGYATFVSGSGTPSDINLKENIQDLNESAIDIVKSIKVKTFDLKESKQKSFGVIAQDINNINSDVLNRLVHKDEYYSIEYDKFGILGIAAIQELLAKINELELRISKLENNK
jgi:hypothetical protein